MKTIPQLKKQLSAMHQSSAENRQYLKDLIKERIAAKTAKIAAQNQR